MEEVSSNQGIYLIKCSKNIYIVEYYYNFK